MFLFKNICVNEDKSKVFENEYSTTRNKCRINQLLWSIGNTIRLCEQQLVNFICVRNYGSLTFFKHMYKNFTSNSDQISEVPLHYVES